MITYFTILATAMVVVSVPIVFKIAKDRPKHLRTLMYIAGFITALYTISTFIYIFMLA